ncbi:hypothetical protein PAXINDRAFT_20942, partial [Paxillus involutus ATCC 200175]
AADDLTLLAPPAKKAAHTRDTVPETKPPSVANDTPTQPSPLLPLKRKAGHEVGHEVDELPTPPKKKIASAAHPLCRHESTLTTLLHASSQTTASQSSPFLPLKRKAGHEVDELSAPPKKRIASAARESKHRRLSGECYLWRLPNELLILIANHLVLESLHVLMHVCKLLREIASPRYCTLVNFEAPDVDRWLTVEGRACEALPVWRRSQAFVVPGLIWITASQDTTDRHFRALQIFFESLEGLEGIRRVQLCLYGSPSYVSPSLTSFLESVQSTNFLRNSSLKVLNINLPLLFTPPTVSFTLTILRNAPLRKLTLTNTTFKPKQWSTLLSQLDLPQLSQLAVDDTCPIPALVDFLHRHKVCNLLIHHKDDLTPPLLPWQSRSRTPLPSLVVLDGSPAIILSLMRLVDISHPFQRLVVRLDSASVEQNHLSDLLSCTEYLTDLHELHVIIPDNATNLSNYPEGDMRVCPAKDVWLSGTNPLTCTDVILKCLAVTLCALDASIS